MASTWQRLYVRREVREEEVVDLGVPKMLPDTRESDALWAEMIKPVSDALVEVYVEVFFEKIGNTEVSRQLNGGVPLSPEVAQFVSLMVELRARLSPDKAGLVEIDQ